MSTAQQFLITATVDGRALTVFETCTGGEPSADVAKTRPGGMAQEQSHAALATFSDLTIGRTLDLQRDLEVYRSLLPRVGRAQMSVSKQPLDEDGAPWGRPLTYTGRLMGMTDIDADSNDPTPSVWTMTMSCTGRA